jgi:hypothetical protein
MLLLAAQLQLCASAAGPVRQQDRVQQQDSMRSSQQQAPPPLPSYSWETLPVGLHGSRPEPRGGDIEYMARFRVVVTDKFEGWGYKAPTHVDGCTECNASATACNEEGKMLATLEAVKRANASVITMAYMNTLLNFPMYALAGAVYANDDRLATRDDQEDLIRYHADGHGKCSMLTFDWAQTAARTAWLNSFEKLRGSGFIDGMYVDKSGSWPGYAIGQVYNATDLCQHGCFTLSNQSAAAWTAGKLNLLQTLDEDVCDGGICTVDSGFITAPPLVKLGYHPSSVHFFGKEHTKLNNDTITVLHSLEGRAKHVLFYGSCESETEVAFFLVSAWQTGGMYCMTIHQGQRAQFIWEKNPHFSNALGAPVAAAELKGGSIWHRSFGKGVQVTFDITTNHGTVMWGTGPVPPPPVPPPVPAPPSGGVAISWRGGGCLTANAKTKKSAVTLGACTNTLAYGWHVAAAGGAVSYASLCLRPVDPPQLPASCTNGTRLFIGHCPEGVGIRSDGGDTLVSTACEEQSLCVLAPATNGESLSGGAPTLGPCWSLLAKGWNISSGL